MMKFVSKFLKVTLIGLTFSFSAFAEYDGGVDGLAILCPQIDCYQNYQLSSGTVECCYPNGANSCVNDGSMKGFYATCTRTSNNFTKMAIDSYYTGTSSADFRLTTWYSLDWGGGMVWEPSRSTQTNATYLNSISQPIGSSDSNWMLIHWDNDGQGSLVSDYVLGAATVNPSSGTGSGAWGLGVNLTTQWHVDGTVFWEDPVPMRGDWNPYGGNAGFYLAYNNLDSEYLNGGAYFNNRHEGYNAAIKNGDITRLTTFFPEQVLNSSDFQNREFSGIIFDANTGTTVTSEVLPIRVTTNSGAIIRFTVNPYSDVDSDTIRDRSHYDSNPSSEENNWWDAYFDFRSSDFNNPNFGAIAASGSSYGVFNRLGFRTGSGKIICMANKSALYGVRMFCSAQSSDNPDRPFSIVLQSLEAASSSELCGDFGAAGSGYAKSDFGGIFGADLVKAEANAIAVRESTTTEIWMAGALDLVSNGGGFAAVKMLANGTLDTTFSGDGLFETQIGDASTEAVARDLAVQTDGKVVLAGDSTLSGQQVVTLLRLNSNGTTDGTFGSSGVKTLTFGKTGDFEVHGLTMDASGNYYLAGSYEETGDIAGFVAKVTSSGNAATGFATSGLALISSSDVGQLTSPSNVVFYDLVVEDDGKIALSGEENDVNAIAGRLNSNGTEDTSFSSDGFVFNASNGGQRGIVIAAELDGSGNEEYYVAGGFNLASSTAFNYANDGSELNGVGVNAYTSGVDYANGLASQSDGKILMVGEQADNKGYVARLSSSLALDADFNSTGIRAYDGPSGATNTDFNGVVIDSLERILVGGTEGEEMLATCISP